MRLKKPLLLFLILWSTCIAHGQSGTLDVSSLPSLPDGEGFAGMFAGVSNGSLICMGGANFPDKMPWEGGEKVWYDHIFVLDNGADEWRVCDETLPVPLGYGVSVSYNNQIILIGGSNSNQHYDKVFGIEFKNGKIIFDESYPSLPIPLAMMSGAIVNNTVYLAGGLESEDGMPVSRFFSLALDRPVDEREWVELSSWPGEPRQLSVSASKDGKFYLFSGIKNFVNDKGENDRILLKDAFVYDPVKTTWKTLPELPRAVAAAPNPAPVLGLNHIAFPGGLDGNTAEYSDPKTHPGFLESILAYNTLTQTYVEIGNLPDGGARVTLSSAKWKNKWVLINGESGPGVRSPEVLTISNQVKFGYWNWAFLLVYLSAMLYLGFYFSKRGKTTEDYFIAGHRIPWWAAGLSIYGTQLSAITFMAIPAIVYATDWTLAIGSLMILAIVPIIIRYYLPFFRRLNVITAYEYLEARFNVKVRTLASMTFILMQLARIGIILYLPSIAISAVTGIDVFLCIAIMGVFCTIYTVMGGIEAVIWTDVIQVVILLGGALLSIIVASINIEGGFSEIIHKGLEFDKFKMFHWGLDPSRLVFWVAVVSFFFLNIIPYTSDQTVVQRYLTVKDEKEAAKSLWTNGLLMLPGILIFFGLGTTLFVFYMDNPVMINANKPDELLPFYIVSNLPVGIAGMVIAAIFTASMSSLDSSMNSISSAYIIDIHPQFKKITNDRANLRLAKWITLFIGFLGTSSGMLIALADVEYIFDYFQELLGLFGGGLAGIFVLAVFVRKANSMGAIVGLFGSALVTWVVKSQTDITIYLYGGVGVVSCVLIGYLVSLFVGDNKKDQEVMTYHSLVKEEI